ncbi:peroxidase [Paraoerskovia sediminicola]|uniref:Peroxidase n=1 Tax=Paraoerskovia sediminicola TaxID=1138587 RepID=A0ABM8G4L0_9CELL|nr:Dyp-type peroxidase [Paraoerskovia sediminicola]BDZ43086.1 peroxidase [Paraoerskovia sediminicola]
MTGRRGLDRRSFLQGGAAALGGAALALGGRELVEAAGGPVPGGGATAGGAPGAPTAPDDAVGRATEGFRGTRQAGVATPPQASAAFVALDLAGDVDRAALVRLMRIWTDDIERLTSGRAPLADTEAELAAVPARLTVTVGFGPAALAAAGVDEASVSWPAALPPFGIDRLEDRWSGGDLVLQVCADDPLTVAHAVRLLAKDARSFAEVRWVQRGFRRAVGTTPSGTTMRNLMGQVDGTANPHLDVDANLIWREDGSTSMVVRRIAMNLDTWDELDRDGREKAVGRRLDTGAPLTGGTEHDEVDLEAEDEHGLTVVAPFAHVRRARTDDRAQRFLRRGYNYDDAPSGGAVSDSGLVFVTFQADVEAQLVPVQRRLDELDLLNEWTTPVGSAVFWVPPGAGSGEILGQSVLGG